MSGRNRKSRGTEAAGRGNDPEAVPRRKGRKKEADVSIQISGGSVGGDADLGGVRGCPARKRLIWQGETGGQALLRSSRKGVAEFT